eukprot:5853711-Prymnesium_polylepis.1
MVRVGSWTARPARSPPRPLLSPRRPAPRGSGVPRLTAPLPPVPLVQRASAAAPVRPLARSPIAPTRARPR